MKPSIVIDTNVLIAALRSRRDASFKVISLMDRGLFQLSVSVPLFLEYESVAKRISKSLGITYSDIDDILDYICHIASHRKIYYLWRPFLRDPGDDMVLEVAVESESDFIVTHNIRDFIGIEQFGIKAITPKQLLNKIGELS